MLLVIKKNYFEVQVWVLQVENNAWQAPPHKYTVLCTPLILNNVNTNIRDAAGAAQDRQSIDWLRVLLIFVKQKLHSRV